MDATSQVVLRNSAQLGSGPVLLVDCPPDGLAEAVAKGGRVVRTSNQEHGAFAELGARGVPARFEPVPRVDGDESLVVLRLPREKERFAMLLHALAAGMRADARLWVVGEKRAGIDSATKRLVERFHMARKLDAARHCGLLEASGPMPGELFRLGDYVATYVARTARGPIELCSLPGVFAHRRLDDGSALLIESLARLDVHGEVLDFACGNGVLALSLLARPNPPRLTLLDHSALALEAARRSLALNAREARVIPSNGLDAAVGRYDWIVSNPPFHHGVRQDLDVVSRLFSRAGTFLRPNGKIVVVFNRHLPYQRWADSLSYDVERLAQNRDYTVIQMSRTQ